MNEKVWRRRNAELERREREEREASEGANQQNGVPGTTERARVEVKSG